MINDVKKIYKESFEKNGYSADSLLWFSDKMNIRYDNLIKHFPISDSCKIVDIGCGFGDMNKYLSYLGFKDYEYLGIDIIEEFIEIGREKYGNDKIKFICGDFLEIADQVINEFDYMFISGVFNTRLDKKVDNNYNFLFSFIDKAFRNAQKGISFNFISDKVDFKRDNVAYHSPVAILEHAYTLSKRVILNNFYMPFESTCILCKNDTINLQTMLFEDYEKENIEKFKSGIFSVKEKDL